MSALTINLFGKFSVQAEGQSLEGFDACKVQELLSYLLVNRARPHTRESLASLLWGETSTDKSKKYLRQTLWHLQTALENHYGSGDKAPEVCALLSTGHDWVRLNDDSALWLDVEIFERAFTRVQGKAGRDLDEETKRVVQEAVELYKGDLLEGWYQDWCLYERERLQNMYLVMLDKLINYCEAERDYEMGLLYGSIILRYDRARERTHRQLMHLLYMAGDRTAALRQYERCVSALREELDVAPDRRTVALYQQIRLDQLEERALQPAATSPEAETQAATAASPVSLPEVLGRLQQLQLVMSDVQRRIQQDIKAVQQALKH
ncbi:MAG TPA: bacterial transcriptional activator domain-containing protein [Pyrinomonadaceae bacterium]|nr:bacterial transcriptional activator domain-containing protein [Pyrinomonadaceae bacterium]